MRTTSIQRRRKRQKQRISELIAGIKSYADCELCGEENSDKLTFHHRDPATKEFNVGSGARYTVTKVIREICKCDIVCRDCHDDIHSTEKKTLDSV